MHFGGFRTGLSVFFQFSVFSKTFKSRYKSLFFKMFGPNDDPAPKTKRFFPYYKRTPSKHGSNAHPYYLYNARPFSAVARKGYYKRDASHLSDYHRVGVRKRAKLTGLFTNQRKREIDDLANISRLLKKAKLS